MTTRPTGHLLRLRSAIPGRLRWDVPALRGNSTGAAYLSETLTAHPGLGAIGVYANPHTGTLLVVFDPEIPIDLMSQVVTETVEAMPRAGGSPFSPPPAGHATHNEFDEPIPQEPRGRSRLGWIAAAGAGLAALLVAPALAVPAAVIGGVAAAAYAVRKKDLGALVRRHDHKLSAIGLNPGDVASRFEPLRRLLTYKPEYRPLVRRAATLTFINKSLDLAPPFLIALAVDIVSGGTALTWLGITGVMPQLLLLTALSIAIWAAESWYEYKWQRAWQGFGYRLQHDLRRDLYDHVQRVEMRYIEDRTTGHLIKVVNSDVNQIERFFQDGIGDFFGVATNAAVVVVAFVLFAPLLSVFTLLPVPFIIWYSLRYEKQAAERLDEVREVAGHFNALLVNNLTGMSTIRSFTAERTESDRVDALSAEYEVLSNETTKLTASFTPNVRMAVLFGFAGTTILGGALVGAGSMTPGVFAFMMLLTQRTLWPLTSLGHAIDNFDRTMIATNRVFGLLEAPVGPPSGGEPLSRDAVRGAVSFESVSFGYVEGQRVLDNFSVDFLPGRTTAIVGVTGSGKTTIAKLLLRFYDCQEGRIVLDGRNIRDFEIDDLRRAIGLVSQDVFLFDGTIFENIAYGRAGQPGAVTIDDVRAAAEAAEAADFIESLPDGYETLVGERGVKLSGGQRQRVCLARAILKDAPILILDEATSSVDNETEAAIHRSLERMSAGRTTIAIAHRLSTIRFADRIYVLGRQGRIVEQGSHDELVALNGYYAALWRVQTGEDFDAAHTPPADSNNKGVQS